jgi:hypothetical protein
MKLTSCVQWLILIVVLLASIELAAQRPRLPGGGGQSGPPPGTGASGGQLGTLVDDFVDTDSFTVKYIYKEIPWDTLQRGDTSKYWWYHIYDPARHKVWDDLHVGIPGSASRSVRYAPTFIEGNHLGVHVFDSYMKRTKQLPLFFPEKPFADVSFRRGADQDDFVFDGTFSNTFQNGLNFTLDYQRLGQIGEYQRQRLRNTNLVMGLHYKWWSDKVHSYLSFANNSFIQDANGGIQEDSLLLQPQFNIRIGIPTFLPSGRTQYEQRSVELYNSLYLTNKSAVPIQLYNSITYERERYLFFDINNPNGAAYFGPFFTDERGVRHNVLLQSLRNEIGVDLATESLLGLQAERIRAGLIQKWIQWAQDPIAQPLNEVSAFGEAYVKLGDKVTAEAKIQQGLFDATGNNLLFLKGKLSLPFKTKLNLSYERQALLPSLIDRSVNISFRNVYTNEFTTQKINQIRGEISNNIIHTRLEFGLVRALDLILYDTTGIPSQEQTGINLFQIGITQQLKLGHIYWNQSLLYQAASSTKLGIPPLFYKGSLFYEKPLFRGKSPVRLGCDYRLIPEFTSLTYLPMHAQWAFLENRTQRFLPEMDVFASMKVKVFRFYARFENLLGTFNGYPLFHHYRFPMHERRFSFGVYWILVD